MALDPHQIGKLPGTKSGQPEILLLGESKYLRLGGYQDYGRKPCVAILGGELYWVLGWRSCPVVGIAPGMYCLIYLEKALPRRGVNICPRC